jgi:hypothetical protein
MLGSWKEVLPMRRAHFVILVSFGSVFSAALAQGCGSGSGNATCPPGEVCSQACPAGETCTPNDGGGTTGDGSPVSGGDSGGTVLPPGCTDGGPASDDPACNACAYANCCKQVDDCANDPDCTAIINCEAACAPTDEQCLLTCQLTADPTTLEAVGNCVQQKCPTQCQGPDSGPGDFSDF